MSQRLEADLVGHFADTAVRIAQERLRLFDPNSREVIREGQAGRALEELTKIKCARVNRFRDRGQTQGVVLVLRDKMLRLRDRRRLGRRTLTGNLIARDRQGPAET